MVELHPRSREIQGRGRNLHGYDVGTLLREDDGPDAVPGPKIQNPEASEGSCGRTPAALFRGAARG